VNILGRRLVELEALLREKSFGKALRMVQNLQDFALKQEQKNNVLFNPTYVKQLMLWSYEDGIARKSRSQLDLNIKEVINEYKIGCTNSINANKEKGWK